MRYINADEVGGWIDNWFDVNRYYHPYSKSEKIPASEVKSLIHRIPTADVRENVKGEWSEAVVKSVYGEERLVRSCTVCGCSYFRYDLSENTVDEVPKFCPNCGADMRGDANAAD